MHSDVGLRFHVRSSGNVETLVVDAPCALIGTAAHCEVRLPRGGGAHEHVEVLAMHGGVSMTTRAGAPPVLLDGYPFVSGPWPRTSVVVIGEVEIMVEAVDLRPNVRTRSPFWALAPVPALAAAVLVFARSSTAAEAEIPPAPELFDPPVATCPSQPSATLGAFAAERARIGYAKRARSPFSRGDGIEAVALLEMAAACHHAAGQVDAEHEARATAQALRGKLEEEYRVRRVRVEHAVRVGDPAGAERELSVLIPLTAHRRGAYVDWLASMDRHAKAAIDQRARRL